MTNLHSRIKLARRLMNVSQTKLASEVGVQRSAVSHWESPLGKNPTLKNLRKIAEVTAVRFEWLATGRGAMALSSKTLADSIPAVLALMVDDELEIRMLEAMREVPLDSKMSLVEIAEQIAAMRLGKSRRKLASKK